MQKYHVNERKINGLFEASFLTVFIAGVILAEELIAGGGIYTLALLPIITAINAWIYYDNASRKEPIDSIEKRNVNYALHALRILTSGAGAILAMLGMLQEGFGLMIAMTYLDALRATYKSVRSKGEGDATKMGHQLHKAIVSALMGSGFMMMTFFPSLHLIGAITVWVAAGHIILSLLPSVMSDVLMPAKTMAPVLSHSSSSNATRSNASPTGLHFNYGYSKVPEKDDQSAGNHHKFE